MTGYTPLTVERQVYAVARSSMSAFPIVQLRITRLLFVQFVKTKTKQQYERNENGKRNGTRADDSDSQDDGARRDASPHAAAGPTSTIDDDYD